jgi:hypothetical protein
MIQTAENIILSKEFHELTAEELATVSELVQNAEDFEEMKWFLASTQQAVIANQIEPSPALKKSVLEHLNQPAKKRKFWLNGVIPFLLPEDKKFFQKPAFQLSMVAVLVVGFILFYPPNIESDRLALNGVDKEFEGKMKPEGSGEVTTSVTEEPMQDALLKQKSENEKSEQQRNQLAEFDILSEEVIEFEESEDLPHDGYYSGPINDKDLKRIEDATNKDEISVNTVTTFGNTNGTPNNPLGANSNVNPPVVSSSDVNELKNVDNNLSTNNPGNNINIERKENAKDKKSNTRDDRLKQNNEAIVVYESQEKSDVDDEINGGGAFDYKPAKEEKISSDLNTGKDYKDIKPYSLHVDQTKELKKFYTTFK